MTRTDRRRLIPFPAAEGNPYLSMLQAELSQSEWKVIRRNTLSSLIELLPRLARDDVIHIHWTFPVTSGAESHKDATRQSEAFRSFLIEARDRGVKIVWTVHNQIAHDTPWPEIEVQIAEYLCDLSDTIIQLHNQTLSSVADTYDLPADKLTTIPHSSYEGIYQELGDRNEAREALGIDAQAPVVGLVGQLRPYKGLDTLFRAADLATDETDQLTLVVAGKLHARDHAAYAAALPRKARLVSTLDWVPRDEMWKWILAMDILALPYRKVLNSGTLVLAATFGRPVIVPEDSPLSRVYADQTWVTPFAPDPTPEDALARAVFSSLETAVDEGQKARAFAHAHPPALMASDYAALLRNLQGCTGG